MSARAPSAGEVAPAGIASVDDASDRPELAAARALLAVGMRLARSAPSGRIALAQLAEVIDPEWIPQPWGRELTAELDAAVAEATAPIPFDRDRAGPARRLGRAPRARARRARPRAGAHDRGRTGPPRQRSTARRWRSRSCGPGWRRSCARTWRCWRPSRHRSPRRSRPSTPARCCARSASACSRISTWRARDRPSAAFIARCAITRCSAFRRRSPG